MLSMCLVLLQNPEDSLRFEEFYNKFYSTVFFIAKTHLITNEAAEDCAQEIMINFAKDFHNIKQDFDDISFRGYVKVVAKGISVDMYRKEKKHLENLVDADVAEYSDVAVEELDVFDEVLLKDALNAMPEAYRFVFYLKYCYEFTGAEIAAKMGISQESVRYKCMRGMKFVREYIKEAEK